MAVWKNVVPGKLGPKYYYNSKKEFLGSTNHSQI